MTARRSSLGEGRRRHSAPPAWAKSPRQPFSLRVPAVAAPGSILGLRVSVVVVYLMNSGRRIDLSPSYNPLMQPGNNSENRQSAAKWR